MLAVSVETDHKEDERPISLSFSICVSLLAEDRFSTSCRASAALEPGNGTRANRRRAIGGGANIRVYRGVRERKSRTRHQRETFNHLASI